MASMLALTRSSSALVAMSGDHHFGHHRLARALCRFDRRLEDGARLHLGDLRIGDREPTAAEAEHRVELVQVAGAVGELLRVGPSRASFGVSALARTPSVRTASAQP